MDMRNPPVAKAGMLIRRPVSEVFKAFVDPAITSKFWFSSGSGRLDAGRPVIWSWDWYGVSTQVDVREIVPNRKILIEWNVGTDRPSTVEWTFDERPDGSAFVDIRNFGFQGDADAQVQEALDTTGGFTWVLAGAKAWLEHGIALGLVPDRFPDAHVKR